MRAQYRWRCANRVNSFNRLSCRGQQQSSWGPDEGSWNKTARCSAQPLSACLSAEDLVAPCSNGAIHSEISPGSTTGPAAIPASEHALASAEALEFECFKHSKLGAAVGGIADVWSWADPLELGEDTKFTVQSQIGPQSEFTPKWQSDSILSWDSHSQIESQSGFDASSEAGWSSVWSGSLNEPLHTELQDTDNEAAVPISCDVSDCSSPSYISTPTATASELPVTLPWTVEAQTQRGNYESSWTMNAPSVAPRDEEPAKGVRMVADKTLVSSLASLLDKPLPPQVALATLTSTSFNPGARPLIFDDGAESQVRQQNTCCLHVHAQSTDTRDPCAVSQWRQYLSIVASMSCTSCKHEGWPAKCVVSGEW